MNRRYAIYGGTFDPIHIGHIAVADAAVRECNLHKMIFMPDYISPFKQGQATASGDDRYAMIKSVLHYNDAFTLSSYEINKEGPSYTIETLEFWDDIVKGDLYFVLGFDSVLEVDTWRRGEDILRNYPLITARRPGADDEAGIAKIEALRTKFGANITILDMPPVDASSTDIRNRVRSGESISDMVPKEVEEYIIEHKLYK